MKIHHLNRLLVVVPLAISITHASDDVPGDGGGGGGPVSPAKLEAPKSDSRIFGVIPNNQTFSLHGEKVDPLSAKEKFRLASKTAIDPGTFAVTGFLAGIGQLNNQYPTFGQGLKGYGHRYGMMYVDAASTAMLTNGVMPALFHQDPRFFRLGEGSTKRRVGYAISRIWMARGDNGKRTFNFGEVFGNAAQAGLSSYYYPAAERNGANIGARTVIAIAPDVVSNLLREFWPDISRKLKHHHKTP